MREGKTSISNAASYEDMADFWDAHDSADYWDEVPSAEFDIDADAQAVYYPLNMAMAIAMRKIAKQRGIRPKTLLAQWVRERLEAESAREEASG